MEEAVLWSVFCNSSECSQEVVKKCSHGFSSIIDPYSCLNNGLVICMNILFLIILLILFILKLLNRKTREWSQSQHLSPLLICSATFNGLLGLAYLGTGIWTIVKKLNANETILPVHLWLMMLFQGLTWLLLGLTISLKKLFLSHTRTAKFCSILAFLLAGFLCFSSLLVSIKEKVVSVKIVLDILSLPGAVLLLFCAFQGSSNVETDFDTKDDTLSEPFLADKANGSSEISSDDNVTPFARAGFLRKMSFWWLNPLMKKGKEKLLENEDIPNLREEDRARTCYMMYMEQLNKQKQQESSDPPSLLATILYCYCKEILISGFFALIKVLAVSTGPLLLKAFIEVAQGKTAFKYEVYVLTGGLFFVKCLESLSDRQWYFRTRLIGLQARSMLSAAIYQKQLQLSNATKMTHSPGEIVSYVAVDAYRIGEFPYWFHHLWATSLQMFLALVIIYFLVGIATVAALLSIILTVIASSPLVRLQHKYQGKLMNAQDRRLKAITEALANMKILKLYAWETHFKKIIEGLRKEEFRWVSKVLSQQGHYMVLFWSSPILVPTVTFWTCYFLGIALNTSNVFTFLATLRLVQEPIRIIPDVVAMFIEAKVSLSRIQEFLEAPQLQNKNIRQKLNGKELNQSVFIRSSEISWDTSPSSKLTLRNINLVVKPGEKVAICGEVGSGKSTLLAAILGEVPKVNGTVLVYGKIAYVSQTAWIQTGTIRENIVFGSSMNPPRYQEVLQKSSLVKDIEMLPFGDQTLIGEKGVNLSGGQKQRVQLARALYQDADVYLLDDPFSAVDAHTATSLFNDYVMEGLSGKTVILVTHQVDFLPAFNSILLMSSGEILRADTYDQLLASSQEFQDLVNAHNDTARTNGQVAFSSGKKPVNSKEEIQRTYIGEQVNELLGGQLIKQEEREMGDTGFKPYMQYLNQNKGFLHFSLATIFHIIFIVGQMVQSVWLAADIQNSGVGKVELYGIYTLIGCILAIFLYLRSFSVVVLGCNASESIFSTLLSSLFRAPMAFYDSTPLGRILSRVSSDLSIVDLEVAFKLTITLGSTMNSYAGFAILAVLSWPLLFVIIPMIYVSILLQRYYFASSNELKRINGTTKSLIASHLNESIAGAMTIRAFKEEDRFFLMNLQLIDSNAAAYFHSFSADEWLIQRLEILCAIVLSLSALTMILIPYGASASGFIGMALSYGLSLNIFLVVSVQSQCLLANLSVSVERLEQYMHIPSEAPEVIEDNRPPHDWLSVGKVEISNLKVKYQPDAPLVLKGISCIIEGGHKVGIVGRTGSGKTTLISILFRLVEPTEGNIVIDNIDICTIGLHDLRSRLAIIPQDPTLFTGSIRYNLDPLSKHTDPEIWEVLEKCKLREAIEEKDEGLDSLVVQDGSNWSMGQRQLFCLGRALLKRSRILVLDEATASIDNATDSVIQKTIRREFKDCTVITVAHRIPTVMDCTMVLAMSDGQLVEYDEPLKLMKKESSLFGKLVKEYWSHSANSGLRSEDWA